VTKIASAGPAERPPRRISPRVCLLCCLFLFQAAWARQWKREEITSAYIFNFAKNIEWQNENRISEFHFLIISDDDAINREMSVLSASRKLKDKPIRITVSESVVIPKDVHLIFITRGLKDLVEPVFRRIEGRKTLLITDGCDDKRMVMINLIGTKNETIRFEINKANIINQGLNVLPDMVLLGGSEIDVAKLYKEAQDTLRIKERKIAALRLHLDSLNAQIAATYGEIHKQNRLIEAQNRDILGQQNQLGMQRDTLSQQTALLRQSQRMLKQQQSALERQQSVLEQQRAEVENGKAVLSHQQAKIGEQNASILEKIKVLGEQDMTIADQKKIQRFLILTIILVLGLTYTIYRSYKSKQQSNRQLQEQEKRIKGLNRDLLERADALETANKDLESFSYSVSHDLRAPLRSIDEFSLAVVEDYGDKIGKRGKDYLTRVRSAAQHMDHLIEDMFNLSRVTRKEVVLREMDLSGMANDIAEKSRGLQPARRIDFAIQPGISAKGDEHLLRIALENLFGNALKYTSKHPSARIEFGMRTFGPKPACYIKDDGAGFDMRHAQRLFGAFQRLHTDEEFPGTGVGLATVQRIMRRHGGDIWAEGEVEKGATFYFSIPGMQSRSAKGGIE
jgi:signal transduction histidine kinase